MPRPLLATLVAALACTATLAACGGDDDAPTTSATLGDAELVAQADAICKRFEAQAKAVPDPRDVADATEAARYFGAVAPLARRQQTALEALDPAASLQAPYDAFLAASRRGTELLETLARKAAARDASGMQQLGQLEPLSQAIDAAADRVGLRSCAQ